MQKKILIRAYVNINLGDDIFIKMLCDRYPEHQFYLMGSKINTQPFKDLDNLTIIKPIRYVDTLLYRLKLNVGINQTIQHYVSKKCDAVIHIGGSIFIEPENSWHRKINNYKKSVENSKNFFVLGSNFGPYTDPNFFLEYQEIFSEIDDICFRDEYSYNKFSNLSNTRLAPDIVFALESSNVEEFSQNEEEYIVISVIDLSWRDKLKEYTELYEKSIIDIAKRMISEGKKVVLMSFCASEGDEEAITRILEKFPSGDIESYFYNGNITEALSILKSSDGVIATRFHSLILGWVFNKPVFTFVYSNKTLNLLNDIEFEGYHLSIKDISVIDIDQVINQLIEEKHPDIKQERTDAEKHFMKTDEFLGRNTQYIETRS